MNAAHHAPRRVPAIEGRRHRPVSVAAVVSYDLGGQSQHAKHQRRPSTLRRFTHLTLAFSECWVGASSPRLLGCGGVASIRRTVTSKRTLGWGRSLVLGEGLGMYGQIPLDKLESLNRRRDKQESRASVDCAPPARASELGR